MQIVYLIHEQKKNQIPAREECNLRFYSNKDSQFSMHNYKSECQPRQCIQMISFHVKKNWLLNRSCLKSSFFYHLLVHSVLSFSLSIHFRILITWYAHCFAMPLFCFIIYFLIGYILLLSFHLRALLKMLCSNIISNSHCRTLSIHWVLGMHWNINFIVYSFVACFVFTRRRRREKQEIQPANQIHWGWQRKRIHFVWARYILENYYNT